MCSNPKKTMDFCVQFVVLPPALPISMVGYARWYEKKFNAHTHTH